MNRVLTSEIWAEVKRRAGTAKTRKAAIAYVTKDLIGFRAGDVLVVDASERAIRSGQTDAHLLRKLYRKGVSIHGHKGLHSKVLLLGQYAIIGSANMSGAGLIEASIVSDNPTISSGIASFIAQLATRSSKLTAAHIAALCRIKVVRTGWLNANRRIKPKKLRRIGNNTWIIGVNALLRAPPAKEQKYIDRANRDLNARLGTDQEDYNWIRWGKRSKFSKQCREGDTLIEICNLKGRKRRVVTRRLPVLLRRNEPDCVRFYVGEASRDSDEVAWSKFQRILKNAGHTRQVRPYSVQLLDPDIADAIDRKWNRTR
jgi:hypothetical protein